MTSGTLKKPVATKTKVKVSKVNEDTEAAEREPLKVLLLLLSVCKAKSGIRAGISSHKTTGLRGAHFDPIPVSPIRYDSANDRPISINVPSSSRVHAVDVYVLKSLPSGDSTG